jgi:hypothetical protein
VPPGIRAEKPFRSAESCSYIGDLGAEMEALVGAHSYFYFTPYRRDIQAALQALREREFEAGRYDPAMGMTDPPSYMFQMHFPPDESWPTPGAQHASIEEAIEASAESGTGSILDLSKVGSAPDFCTVSPLNDQVLTQLFGTTKPTRDLLESVLIKSKPTADPEASELFWKQMELFWDQIKRGEGRYIIIYSGSEPREIFFAGYSID